MRELPDNTLNADIARTLKFDTALTPRHQQDARARLLRSAAAQTALPPLELQIQRTPLRVYARRLLDFLITDSGIYERARRQPRFYHYYNAHGRYAFRVIPMSA